MITETNIIFMTLFTHFSKTTAPQQVIFSGQLSTIIIFKLCKFSVNLWTLFFFSYKKYLNTLKLKLKQTFSTYLNFEPFYYEPFLNTLKLKLKQTFSQYLNFEPFYYIRQGYKCLCNVYIINFNFSLYYCYLLIFQRTFLFNTEICLFPPAVKKPLSSYITCIARNTFIELLNAN